MNFLSLLLPVLLTLPPAPTDGGPIWRACGQEPYYHCKHGFHGVVAAKDHAYREFRKAEAKGALDPSRDEWFCYIYTLEGPDRPAFFHSPWQRAAFSGEDAGSLRHHVASPLAETAGLRIYTLMHSHPTRLGNGLGPSRVDVATASKYKNPDGSYRYLYLINSRGHLIQFKARRDISPHDGAAMRSMPQLPRRSLDWLD